jgi:hypothetical protein
MSSPDTDISGAPMEPTAEAIDAWRAQGGENGIRADRITQAREHLLHYPEMERKEDR